MFVPAVSIKQKMVSGLLQQFLLFIPAQYFMVDWNDNWVAFLDTYLQTSLGLFGTVQVKTELPTEISKLIILPQVFLEFIKNSYETTVNVDETTTETKGRGKQQSNVSRIPN